MFLQPADDIGTGNFIGVSDSGGTETTRDSSTTPDGSTVVALRTKISSNGATIQFFLNGTQVGANVTTNIPTAELWASLGIRTTTTARRSFDFANLVLQRAA